MRYAIYFTPAVDSVLWKTLCSWLGRDPETRQKVDQPSFHDVDPDYLRAVTRTPRKYGAHATLKAPFRLAPEKTLEMLETAMEDFSLNHSPLVLPPLTIAKINDFYCLVPSHPSKDLQNFAAKCVQEFDQFRAPLTPLELAKRKASILTDKEKQYLHLWGYPYVLDLYRFHITLTKRINEDDKANIILKALKKTFAVSLRTSHVVENLCLFVEPSRDKELFLSRRFPLRKIADEQYACENVTL